MAEGGGDGDEEERDAERDERAVEHLAAEIGFLKRLVITEPSAFDARPPKTSIHDFALNLIESVVTMYSISFDGLFKRTRAP